MTDSETTARFVRLSTMQVELNGSVGAALGLEMIEYIRKLEGTIDVFRKAAGQAIRNTAEFNRHEDAVLKR